MKLLYFSSALQFIAMDGMYVENAGVFFSHPQGEDATS